MEVSNPISAGNVNLVDTGDDTNDDLLSDRVGVATTHLESEVSDVLLGIEESQISLDMELCMRTTSGIDMTKEQNAVEVCKGCLLDVKFNLVQPSGRIFRVVNTYKLPGDRTLALMDVLPTLKVVTSSQRIIGDDGNIWVPRSRRRPDKHV